MRRPLELAVHLTRGRQDRDLAHARSQTGLETQVTVEGARVLGRLRAIKPDPARALQPGDRGARRRHPVVVRLAGVVQIFAFRQRQAEPRLGIDVGWHDLSHGRRRTDLRQSRQRTEDAGGGDEKA
jgi:hypothetical protein